MRHLYALVTLVGDQTNYIMRNCRLKSPSINHCLQPLRAALVRTDGHVYACERDTRDANIYVYYVCMYIVSVGTRRYVRMSVCIYVRIYVCMYAVFVHTHTHLRTYVYVCMYVLFTYAYVFMCIYIYIYIYV